MNGVAPDHVKRLGGPTIASGSLLASDQERETTAARLTGAAREGRLTVDELEERLAVALRARHFADLAGLVADLAPAPRKPESGGSEEDLRQGRGPRQRVYEHDRERRAQRPRSALLVATVLLLIVLIAILAKATPTYSSHRINPNSVNWSQSGGNPCAADGGISTVTATYAAGPYQLYQVVCNDGAEMTW